jgi:Ran-binding protein 3
MTKGGEIDVSSSGSGANTALSHLSQPFATPSATAQASAAVAASESTVVSATASVAATAAAVGSGSEATTVISSTPTGASILVAGRKDSVDQRPAPTFSFGGMRSGVTFRDAAAAAVGSTGFSFAEIPVPSIAPATGTGLGVSNGTLEPARGIGSVGRDSAPGLVKLAETDLVTGEEDEAEMFRARCKLFVLEEGGSKWLERGIGHMKLNCHRETTMGRLLMRTEATLRVILNTPVFKGFTLDRAADRSVRFQGINVDDETKYATYLARFNSKDDVNRLAAHVDDFNKQDLE